MNNYLSSTIPISYDVVYLLDLQNNDEEVLNLEQ